MTVIRLIVATVATGTLFLAAACSGDDDGAGHDTDETTTSERPTTTEEQGEATTRPADELRQDVQALLTTYDEIIAQIVADPAIAADRENPLYGQLRALMTPSNTTIDPVINALVAAGNRGERQVPEGDHRLPIERRIEGGVETVGTNRFNVLACGHLNYRVFDSGGQPLSVVEGYVEPSEVTMVRVEGDLRIEQFESVDANLCREGEQ